MIQWNVSQGSCCEFCSFLGAFLFIISGMDPLMMEESDYVKSLRILTGDARDSMVGASRVGCTCCMCLVQRHSIIMANVGDSRVVLCQNGLAVPLSVDHKPNLPIERERIMRAGGTVEQQEFSWSHHPSCEWKLESIPKHRRLGLQT